MRSLYLELVDIVLDLLDSIARQPFLWAITVTAAIFVAMMIYDAGYVAGVTARQGL